MDSSQSDEFFDDWGSPGFRDQLFRNVALAEMQAEQAQATNNNSCSHKLIQTNTHERSGTSLQVFRDPLDHVKGSVAFPQQHPLREIDLNQHDTGFNNNHKKLGKEGVQKRKQDTTIITVADNSTINQSLNDSMDTNQSNNASKLQEQQNPNNVDMKKADIDEDEEMWGVEFDIDFPELLNDLERNHDTTAQNNESSFKIDIHPIDETKEVSFDKKQMESTLFEFGGFETAGSRKPLRINNEARKNAFALFSVDSIDSGLNKAISSTSPGNNTINNPLSVPNTQKDTTTINARDHKTDPTDDKVKIQESLEGFSGFKTASNRTIPRISEESLRKAERLLLGSQSHDMQTGTLPATEKKEEQTQNGTVKISNSNNSIVNDQQRPPFATANSDNEETIPPPTKILHGFKTASGRDISPTSKEALYKAEKLVLATQSPDEQTKISMKGESTGTVNGEMSVCGEKRSSDNDHYDSHDDNNDTDDNQLQFKYEDLLSRHGGFTKGTSDITISVSVDAKQRAVALFNSSETTRELTQASQSISSQRLSSTSSPLRGNSQQQQYNDHSSLPSQRTISSLEETQPSPSSPKQKSPERFPPLPPHPRKRLKRRPQAAMLKMKPFKSPVIQSKYELTKAAASGKVSSASVRYKGKPVFSINSQSPRHPLSQLGKPLQYTVVDLKNMDIKQCCYRTVFWMGT
ncbi:hypothetical protein BDA99DRAFT_233130 [Phascolomyces articulosus]|uniref:Uncharacterized protein n=1 Tax=Phascolomyces articulosus TaxID=60185 RepID=A0AAD5P8U2_9FUNG|nr:hypothetical protein BDA99DRAFT_233130 [Phascolomyces articulosus]